MKWEGAVKSQEIQMDPAEIVEAFKSFSLKKKVFILENIRDEALGQTAEGLRFSARGKKERRRFEKEKDPRFLDWIGTFTDDDVLYDIGANVGTVTLAAAAAHPNLRIVAIEPAFANFESLARNLSINGLLATIIPLQMALLDRTGIETLNYFRSNAVGTALHTVGEAVGYLGEAFAPVDVQLVPTFTLDDVIATLRLPRPTRLKIDVDGREDAVLHGAFTTLSDGTVRDLMVEIVNHDGDDTRENTITQLLRSFGYELTETLQHKPDRAARGAGNPSIVADCLFSRSKT